jgi:hypothetical protein
MSSYYLGKRSRNIFDPKSKEPFGLSRTKVDSFINCPRCFYIDVRLGVGQPPGYPFSLNQAVDTLLKKEFDIYRANKEPHPLMKAYNIDAVPFAHEKLDEWREARTKGIAFFHEPSNFYVRGGIDDVWINPQEELYIVDYKATAKNGEVSLDAEWQGGYKRQMEIYQWLFRQNGFTVSPTGYFVYVNGKLDKESFDAKLEFDIKILPYKGDDSWVEEALVKAKECLMQETLPSATSECDFCVYRKSVQDVLTPFIKK